MREGYWVIRTYESGNVGEKTKYFVPGKRPEKKIRREDSREASRQEKNSSCATKQLARLLNENFPAGCDAYLIGLDYNDKGLAKIMAWADSKALPMGTEEEKSNTTLEAADHEMVNALRRVKRSLPENTELRAVYISSDMDGETGELVRVHHHMVINADALPAFRKAWEECGMGSVDYEKLWENQLDRTPLAEYWMKQVRKRPDAKKYRSTRNLIRPEPKDKIALTEAELRTPKGAELLFRQEFRKGGDQYIRYVLPKEKREKKAERRGRVRKC